jgi:hypothetical protein
MLLNACAAGIPIRNPRSRLQLSQTLAATQSLHRTALRCPRREMVGLNSGGFTARLYLLRVYLCVGDIICVTLGVEYSDNGTCMYRNRGVFGLDGVELLRLPAGSYRIWFGLVR